MTVSRRRGRRAKQGQQVVAADGQSDPVRAKQSRPDRQRQLMAQNILAGGAEVHPARSLVAGCLSYAFSQQTHKRHNRIARFCRRCPKLIRVEVSCHAGRLHRLANAARCNARSLKGLRQRSLRVKQRLQQGSIINSGRRAAPREHGTE